MTLASPIDEQRYRAKESSVSFSDSIPIPGASVGPGTYSLNLSQLEQLQQTGLATSAKTLNTDTPGRKTHPEYVYSRVKGLVDEAANFGSAGELGHALTKSETTRIEIQLLVPPQTSPAQWQQLQRAVECGKSRGIAEKVT